MIVEGTQGFGLSPLHSGYYPHVTSRDTTASAFIGEAGLSPVDVDQIILVLRSYPIRVGGNSGHLPNETTWEYVSAQSGYDAHISEYTSVTNVLRRIGMFDPKIVHQAIQVNNPTHIVLNHLDYIDSSISTLLGVNYSKKAIKFLFDLETQIGRRIAFVGTSRDRLISVPQCWRSSDQHSFASSETS